MYLSTRARKSLAALTFITISFIYIPLITVVINSFNPSKTFSWPPQSFSTIWWRKIGQSAGLTGSIMSSIKVGIGATLIALLLGTAVAFAVSRYNFFGKSALSLFVVFPIALPGIVTGIALNTTLHTLLDPMQKEIGRAHV